MTVSTELLMFFLFLGLLISGMWIPFAVGIAALGWLVASDGVSSLIALGLVSWGSMNSFTLTAIPLFILMAEILLESGLSHRVFRGLTPLVRPLPGGLLQTGIAGCAMFSAVSGSSVACAAAIGTVSTPQFRARGYNLSVASGALAAGGTLGILIPPSIALIVYASFAQVSILDLFAAGLIPGLMLAAMFMIYLGVLAWFDPSVAPRASDEAHAEIRWREVVADIVPFCVLILLVMGSLYSGVVTPTESAALGCCLSWAVARIWGQLDFAALRRALRKTVLSTGSIMFVVYAAFLFSYAIGQSGLAEDLSKWVAQAGVSRLSFLLCVILALSVIGCFVDSMGMMVITVPILLPSLAHFQVDVVWFGILIVLLVELGQITPPMGMNLFVIRNITGEPLGSVIRGAIPFYLIYLLAIALIIVFPGLVLWLPGTG